MELLPAFAFFMGAAYLVYRLARLDTQIERLKKRIEDLDGSE
jgi:hypothetical protein